MALEACSPSKHQFLIMQTQMMQKQVRLSARRETRAVRVQASAETQTAVKGARVLVKEQGVYSVKGTVRKINEDRSKCQVAPPSGKAGEPIGFAGVYDGHGGYAVAEWLETKLLDVISKYWRPTDPFNSLQDAFLAADSQLLVQKGFMGMGERGVGGSKCGATAAVAMLYVDPSNPSQTQLVTANVGDARTVLVRNGQPVQLSVDHVPDDEGERQRIERFNPNPKMPLVRYTAGTWRVGGLLALSRAFGDAYLKGSLQFEGLTEGSDGYSSGFGVIAEPYTTLNTLTAEDQWLIVASDGLFAEEARGGGGGLDNNTLTELLRSAGNAPCDKIAETLSKTAIKLGSTDDVTVVVMRLGTA